MTSENEYTDAAGVRRMAKKTSQATCIGCDHDFWYEGCQASPPCFAVDREDMTWVIWVKAEEGSHA